MKHLTRRVRALEQRERTPVSWQTYFDADARQRTRSLPRLHARVTEAAQAYLDGRPPVFAVVVVDDDERRDLATIAAWQRFRGVDEKAAGQEARERLIAAFELQARNRETAPIDGDER